MNNIIEAIYPNYYNIVPLTITYENGDKKLIFPEKWKKYQKEQYPREKLNNSSGYAVICGKISRNLIVFDIDIDRTKEIDSKEIYNEITYSIPEFKQTFTTKTQSGGLHFHILLDDIKTYKELKNNKDFSSKIKQIKQIDIQGEGKIAIIYPSKNYEVLNYIEPITLKKKRFHEILSILTIQDEPQDDIKGNQTIDISLLRIPFQDILNGKIEIESYAKKNNKEEFLYWKFLFREAYTFGKIDPSQLFSLLQKNQRAFDLEKTEEQLKYHPFDKKPLTTKKMKEFFPDYSIQTKEKPPTITKEEAYKLYLKEEKADPLYHNYRTGQDLETKTFKKWLNNKLQEEKQPAYIEIADYCKANFDVITLQRSRLLMIRKKNHYTFNITPLINCIGLQITEREIENYKTLRGNILEVLQDTTTFREEDFFYGVRYIPFENGFYDIEEETLKKYTKETELTFFYSIPHEYHEGDYKCPKFEEALKKWVINDESKINLDDIYEMLGYTLTSDTGYKALFINLGDTNTGKSQFTNIIEYVIGRDNTIATSLTNLSNRFETRFLQWKIMGIASDMSKNIIEDNSMTKNLSGGDFSVRAEIKGGDIYKFRPTVKFWCNVNRLPIVEDIRDKAFFERVLIILFKKVFEIGKNEDVKRNFYKTIINDPDEIQGIIHKAIEGLQRLIKRKQFRPILQKDTRHRYLMLSNEPYQFVKKYCYESEEEQIKRSDLWDAYIERYGTAYGRNQFYDMISRIGFKVIIQDGNYYFKGLRKRYSNELDANNMEEKIKTMNRKMEKNYEPKDDTLYEDSNYLEDPDNPSDKTIQDY